MKPISCIFLALCAAVSPLSVHAAPGLAPVKKTADVKKEKKDAEKKKKQAAQNTKKCLEKLKKAGYEVTEADIQATDPGLLARFAANGDAKAVKIWLECGMSPNSWDMPRSRTGSKSALALAIENGHHKIAKMLIKAGAKTWEPMAPHNPLDVAIKKGDLEMIKALIEEGGVDVNKSNDRDAGKCTPLMSAAGSSEIVAFLIEAGADVNAKDTNGRTPLHYAAKRKSAESLSLLLQAGADVNAQDGLKNAALHIAVKENSAACVKILLDNGANVTLKDSANKPAGSYIDKDTADGMGIFLLIYGAAKEQGVL